MPGKTLIIILLSLFLWNNALSQLLVGGEYIAIENYLEADKLDSLEKDFGMGKNFPAKYQLQILLALSHFPELKDVKIAFVEKKVFAPLSALPSIRSMLNPFGKRTYRVIISTKSAEEMERILLKNLPINAQVGVIGHELAHIADYHRKSFTELLAVSINYGVNPAYHAWFEKNTDFRTIEHGLGWELYSYSKYVRTIFGSLEREVNLSDDFYMHYNEILFEMKRQNYITFTSNRTR